MLEAFLRCLVIFEFQLMFELETKKLIWVSEPEWSLLAVTHNIGPGWLFSGALESPYPGHSSGAAGSPERTLSIFFSGRKGLATGMLKLWHLLCHLLHLEQFSHRPLCLASPSLEVLSSAVSRVNATFSVRKRPGVGGGSQCFCHRQASRLDLALQLPSHWELCLDIWFPLGFLYCWFRTRRFPIAWVIAACASVLHLKNFGCSWLFFSPPLRFYVILLSFQWCFGRG